MDNHSSIANAYIQGGRITNPTERESDRTVIRPNGNPTERDITFELINALLYGKEVIIIVAGGEHKKTRLTNFEPHFFH